MLSAVDYTGRFGSNPLGDAVTGTKRSDCEEKPSPKYAMPGSSRNEATNSLPCAGSRSALTNRNECGCDQQKETAQYDLDHSHKDSSMSDIRMAFGRHKGMAVVHLPVEYLAGLAEKMATPPAYVLAELQRRAAIKETRDALLAQSALSSRLYPKRRRRQTQRQWWYASADRTASRRSRCGAKLTGWRAAGPSACMPDQSALRHRRKPSLLNAGVDLFR